MLIQHKYYNPFIYFIWDILYIKCWVLGVGDCFSEIHLEEFKINLFFKIYISLGLRLKNNPQHPTPNILIYRWYNGEAKKLT